MTMTTLRNFLGTTRGLLKNPAALAIFAGLYALYAGLLILVTAGVVLSPVLHRILHKFHWAQDRE